MTLADLLSLQTFTPPSSCSPMLLVCLHGREELCTARIELLTRVDDAAIAAHMHSIEESMDQSACRSDALMLHSLKTPRQVEVRPDQR